MSNTSARRAIALIDLVGLPCRITKIATHRELHIHSDPHVDGCLLRAPKVGRSLWLLVGAAEWIRTSPVTATIAITDHGDTQVVILTEDARYLLEFDADALLNKIAVGPHTRRASAS